MKEKIVSLDLNGTSYSRARLESQSSLLTEIRINQAKDSERLKNIEAYITGKKA